MDLKLEVKKLEARETKENATSVWCLSMNDNILGELLSGACSGISC
ncbi:MAG: hypothetical protein SVY15_06460 [Halobacteriota archaeon]|nr:hypothetical protein [Halobacteriota archaeon]